MEQKISEVQLQLKKKCKFEIVDCSSLHKRAAVWLLRKPEEDKIPNQIYTEHHIRHFGIRVTKGKEKKGALKNFKNVHMRYGYQRLL